MTPRIVLLALFGAIPLLAGAYDYARSPPNTYNLFCTYTLTYRLKVTIETEGKQYSSTVVRQQLTPRKWIQTLGGCYYTLGTALAFRLADNRLVLMKTYLCGKAYQAFEGRSHIYNDYADAMRERRKVDVMSLCMGVAKDKHPQGYLKDINRFQGFVIDNADHPARWRGLAFNDDNVADDFRIVSAVAEAFDGKPEDELAKVSAAILKTSFNNRNWSESPEPLIDFFRRYRPDNKFTYYADEW